MVVLLAWVMLICAATTASVEITATLDLAVSSAGAAETRYSAFIATLRLQLEDPKQSLFGIPVLRKLSQAEYMYVKLISATGNSIVVAINKKDIYVQGYTYKDGNQARCFKDVFTTCKVIFPNTKEQNIGYIGSYPNLPDRMKIPLGMAMLGSYIDKISKTQQSNFAQDEGKLLLIVIQMVSEAVRFKYIVDQVKDSIPDNFYPNYKVISLENNWGSLSKAIAGADSKTGRFKTDIELEDAQGDDWIVTNVDEIKPDMGLLNSVGASALPKWLLDDNVPISAQ